MNAVLRNPALITVEGTDGAGKSTQIECIKQILLDHDLAALVTREPGGTGLGEALREVLLNNEAITIGAHAELMLMFAARVQHYEEIIAPALAKGLWVISDRFTDASFAYQGARAIPSQRIEQLENWCLADFRPKLTLLLDLPLHASLSRVEQRGAKDRFERESLQYKKRVRALYLERAAQQPERIKLIEASGDAAQVRAQVTAHLLTFLG